MARKRKDDLVRTINKIAGGKSYCVTLPISIVRELNWSHQQKVCVKKQGRKIIIHEIAPDEEMPC